MISPTTRQFPCLKSSALLLVMLVSLALATCQSRYEWNQKLTVHVRTPSGNISAHSIVRVVAVYGQIPLSGNEVSYGYRGEATVVEVAPGRFLFALIERSEERFYRSVREQFKGIDRSEWLKKIPGYKGVVTLQPNNYPRLVTFADINNPKSIRIVEAGDLRAAFGPGHELISITMEITQEMATFGAVRKAMDYFWWPEERRRQYWCSANDCNQNPMRATLRDGTVFVPAKEDFIWE